MVACFSVLSLLGSAVRGEAPAAQPAPKPVEPTAKWAEPAAKSAEPLSKAADPAPPPPSAAEPAEPPAKTSEPAQLSAAGDKQLARRCFDAAEAAYVAGRLEEARQGFECAYAQLPSPELAWNLARVFERTGDVEQGVRFYREYLERARVSARERRSVELRIKALRDLQTRQAVQLKSGATTREALSSEARVFFQRGLKLYRAAHYAAAAAAFATALQLSEAPELHFNLAMTSQRLGSIQDAYDHYSAYLDALPQAEDRAEVEARMASLRAQLP